MTKKQFSALQLGLSYGLSRTCCTLHHSKAEQHNFYQKCPAEARHQLEMDAAYKVLSELNTQLNTKNADAFKPTE
jgi:hypothetical protein